MKTKYIKAAFAHWKNFDTGCFQSFEAAFNEHVLTFEKQHSGYELIQVWHDYDSRTGTAEHRYFGTLWKCEANQQPIDPEQLMVTTPASVWHQVDVLANSIESTQVPYVTNQLTMAYRVIEAQREAAHAIRKLVPESVHRFLAREIEKSVGQNPQYVTGEK